MVQATRQRLQSALENFTNHNSGREFARRQIIDEVYRTACRVGSKRPVRQSLRGSNLSSYIDSMQNNCNVALMIRSMLNDGEVRRVRRGVYRIS